MFPFYVIRALGGAFFLAGALIMVFNLWRTVRGGEPAPTRAAARKPLGAT
jgi:cytochrome c oxidase cbb3-type subunit 1